jgi:hypothetical protein
MSALPPKADTNATGPSVRYGPIADIAAYKMAGVCIASFHMSGGTTRADFRKPRDGNHVVPVVFKFQDAGLGAGQSHRRIADGSVFGGERQRHRLAHDASRSSFSFWRTFLTTNRGHPFKTAASFGNWFRERCDEAGLSKGISAHGLRKATARRLADLGCTAHQIAAVTGHATLAEVQRYTNAADRKHLAREAMKKLIEGGA